MDNLVKGFEPVYDKNSRVLILGSFPSVKSRQVNFYYGNPRNRFWDILKEYFCENIPQTPQERAQFLLDKNIALWDVVTECEIDGSKDSSIKNFKVANIERLLQNSKICLIILNGSKSYEIFQSRFGDIEVPYVRLPSTSPANVSFKKEPWLNELSRVFGRT